MDISSLKGHPLVVRDDINTHPLVVRDDINTHPLVVRDDIYAQTTQKMGC